MDDPLMAVHVVTGVAGLVLGPAWVLARLAGLRAGSAALGYQAAVACVSATGAVLALTAPGLGWLFPVAVLTVAAAVGGALARRRRWRSWPTLQPHLLGASYIALVTATLVVATGSPVSWVLPAVVGQLPIALAKRRLHAVAAGVGPVPPRPGIRGRRGSGAV